MSLDSLVSARALPRYRQIADRLRREIAEGDHPVGGRFPTEHELCRRFGVSRFTVRSAIRELEDSGLLSRRQGSGSVVTAREARWGIVGSARSLDDLIEFSRATLVTVLGVGRSEEAPIEPAEAAEDVEGDGWTLVRMLRRAEELPTPICWSDLHLRPDVADVVEAMNEPTAQVHELIERRHGVSLARAVQWIGAGAMPDAAARCLAADPGSPAVRVTRAYYDGDDRAVAISVNLHPAGRFTYVTDLARADR